MTDVAKTPTVPDCPSGNFIYPFDTQMLPISGPAMPRFQIDRKEAHRSVSASTLKMCLGLALSSAMFCSRSVDLLILLSVPPTPITICETARFRLFPPLRLPALAPNELVLVRLALTPPAKPRCISFDGHWLKCAH